MSKPTKKRKGGVAPVHSDTLKILVAREYLEGKLSHSELARKHNLNSEATSRYFLKWYEQWESELDLEIPAEAPELDLSNKSERELRDDLFEANLKITALEMMIKKAEELFGTEIGKKSGAKSSKK